MKRLTLSLFLAASLFARSSHSSYHTSRCSSCIRTSRGRILRNSSSIKSFKRQTGYPHGRKGYVIDHIIPLCAGGLDAPSNMQWQTLAESKIKDKIERKECK